MPPEPLPWDRKDFFKEKKHERSDALGSLVRWRDSQQGSREFVRWGSDELRRPLGHGKQGGYQLFSEESDHGCTLSRSCERMVDDEIGRPFTSRAEGKYGRKENKGSFSQKEWKGHTWETGDASVCSSGRQHEISAQRPVDDLVTYASHSHSDTENSSRDQLHYKDHHDKMGSVDGLGTGRRYEKDQSLGSIAWKPLKWTLSGSLSSRGSGFSHSSRSRSIKADSDEFKLDLPSGKEIPVQSPSGDAAAGVTSAASFEDSCPRKKQRLGWGQGLAKYEKQKVEGPDEIISRSGSVPCLNNTEATHGLRPSLSDKSPRVTGLSECASPATPSSVACSSSPDVEDKHYNKAEHIDNDTCNLSGSPGHGFQGLDDFSVNLENLESNPVNNLSSLLAELLHTEDASYEDSSFVRSTIMNKLLLLKSDISKTLEKTEFEIDLFENELKSLNSVSETSGSCPAASISLQLDCASKLWEEPCDAFKVSPKPAPLQQVSSCNIVVEKPISCNGTLEENCTKAKEEIDGPGTASSKSVEPVFLENPVSPLLIIKHEECSTDLGAARSTVPAVQFSLSPTKTCLDGNDLIESSTSTHFSSDLSLQCYTESRLHTSILTSNKDAARKASEVFNKLLPAKQHQSNIWGAGRVSCLQNNSIKEKLAMRKCFLRFKERVLTLKFRAFQHLWKEDMRLLSIRKNRMKSHKRFELSSRTSHVGYQKHRSSIRSRFTSPAGNLTLVPTSEIVDFASKLLSDSQIKLYRNNLKMPPLILDEKEKRLSRFVTRNGLVEDPCAVEKERSMINPWTSKEQEIFLEMLATFGKDFSKIASFLEHKTTADCIDFYYKNQKSVSFEKVKKKLELRKQGRSFPTNIYMMTSGKKWNREVSAASLDMLGAVSVIAAQADENLKNSHACGGKLCLGGYYGNKTSRGDDVLEGPVSVILGNEKEAAAADVLAGICGALSSEAMSSCVTSSVDPGECCQEWKCQKVNSINNRPLTPEVMQNVDDEETCSDESCGELESTDWTDDEKSIFMRALSSYGKDFARISRCVGSRSSDQCKIFFSKARKCLGLDVIHPGSGNEGTPVSDTNEGRSDTEDACVVEMESAICSTQSSSKMDVDLPFSVINTKMEVTGHTGTTNLQVGLDGSGDKNHLGQLKQEVSEKGIKVIERTVVSDDCQAAVKIELVFDGDHNLVEQVENNVGATPEAFPSDGVLKVDTASSSDQPLHPQENVDLTADKVAVKTEAAQLTITSMGESVSAGGSKKLDQFGSNAAVGLLSAPGASAADEVKTGSEGRQTAVTDNGLDDRRYTKICADTNSISCRFAPDSNMNGNASVIVADRSNHPGFSLTANYQHQISLEHFPSIQKPQIISWQQQENCPVAASLVSRDSSVGDHLRQATSSSSSINFEEHGNKQHQKTASTEVYQQYLLGHHSMNQVESSQILRGYPLRMLNKKETNEEADTKSSEKSTVVQSFLKMNRNSQSNPYLVQDVYYDKCNGLAHSHSVAELPLLPKSQEKSSNDHPRSHSRSSSDTEEHSRRTGDFKLFGQILSHPLQKPNPPSHESDGRGVSPKPSSKSFNLKFASDQGNDGTSVPLKLEPCNYSGLEDFPKSYGFWDGNRIQTAVSSLPDSAILLAKYPAAFGDYSTSSRRVEQQPVPSVVTRNDRNMGCVSVFPAKDVNGGARLTDYQVYRSYVGVQPFAGDVKRHEILSELQKQNGFEAVSSFQQQGRGIVGMNVVGGGVLVGGTCTGVSDPVAAIKMHYAATERYGGQAGTMREEESWRGDKGR